MMHHGRLGLFQGFGVELEYMIVRSDDLSVAPGSDELLKAVAGQYVSEVELGPLAWCNELVLHVVELKTNGPASTLDGLEARFQEGVEQANSILAKSECCLMPTAMHPWMDPTEEARLWPHEYSPVYESYNRIFGCQGHGWSNVQSLHMNLPFGDDEEFGRLHAAIRLVLPIIPALAASSPIVDGKVTGLACSRLSFYRTNQRRVPSITGLVIPEAVFTPEEYQGRILSRIYRDISPHDPEGILQFEWLNSRGAIARFDRNTIEIRVLDIQESPAADLAVYRLIVKLLEGLVEERWSTFASQQRWEIPPLLEIFEGTVRQGGQYLIKNPDYLSALGEGGRESLTARELWRAVFAGVADRMDDAAAEGVSKLIWRETLAERILSALGGNTSPEGISRVYHRLVSTLGEGGLFDDGPSPCH
jgi:gamma-glutamyl:cysteine ligase YbdK (ATP-grasp superfamily)